MSRAWQRNQLKRDLAASAVEQLGKGDLAAAEKAFKSTDGDFASRLLAAVEAALAGGITYETEKHVRIPENFEQLSKDELDALVRPFTNSYLRSYPTRGELLDAVKAVDSRQRLHAAWAPYVVVEPLPPGSPHHEFYDDL